MSRLRWPDSTNSVSEKPGTIHNPWMLWYLFFPPSQLEPLVEEYRRIHGAV